MTQTIETTQLPSEPTNSRRSFLKNLGYVAASVASLPLVSGALSKVQAADFSYGTTPSTNVLARKNRNLYLRQFAASIQYGLRVPTQTPNQDERLYQGKIANFSKGLPHNNLGEVDLVAYDRFAELIAQRKRRIERGHGLLENHRQLAAAQIGIFPRRELAQVMTAKLHLTADNLRAGGQ